MANKLPWFTHDHDARDDEFIKRAEDRFGHFGYSGYFKLLEVIHQHGNCGQVTMKCGRLAANLRSRWPQVRLFLDFCQTSGKVAFTLSGDEVQVQNKKFIERQQKFKLKNNPNAIESLRKDSLQEEVYGQGHKDVTPLQAEKNKGFVAQLANFLAWKKRVPYKKKNTIPGAPR